MDGQRRVDQPMTRTYARAPRAGFMDLGQSKRVRIAARASAVLFLALTILHSIILGGYLSYEGSPWMKVPGKLSSLIGWAADDIRITGLVHQEPEMVLMALGVRPGGSLIGFDAKNAKALLENLDWVATATVQRSFPNQLEISVEERVPFAVWQRAGAYYVIDRSGSAMSNVTPGKLPALPLVTGEGAQFALPEARHSLIPGAGGTQNLPRRIGPALAKELMWTARRLSAADAKDIRLVNHVVPKGEALAKAKAIVGEMEGSGPLAIMMIKQAVNRGTEMPVALGFYQESDLAQLLAFSEDRQEGVKAFAEKRKPKFKGQ